MKISVVVATHRRPHALQRCLAALAAQDLPTEDFEVIAVADGPEVAPELELPFAFRWLELDRNQGQSAARTAGARAALTHCLLFLDDDIVAEPGLVRCHLECQAPRRVVFGKSVDSAQIGYYGRLDQDATPRWPDDAWFGPNCSIERSLFEAAGGFDETAFPRCGEDIDLGFRLRARGTEFVYSREAIAVHEDRKGWLARLRAEAAHGAAAIALCRRYPKYRRHVPLRVQRRAWWKRLAAELPYWGGLGPGSVDCRVQKRSRRLAEPATDDGGGSGGPDVPPHRRTGGRPVTSVADRLQETVPTTFSLAGPASPYNHYTV